MEVRVVFRGLCGVIGQNDVIAWNTTHKMCTIRKGEEWKDLGNLVVVENLTSREVNLGANLRPHQTSGNDLL